MEKIGRLFKEKRTWLIFSILLVVTLFVIKYVQSNKYLVINGLIDYEKQIEIPKLEDDWVPQGIAKMDDYLLISAYDPAMEEGESGEGGRPSVIFVVDKQTHEHRKTVTFEGEVEGEVVELRSHFGAIDYVDENDTLYLADSTNGILWQVATADIQAAIDEEGEAATVTAENLMVEREVTPSFLAYHNGLLYIGQHDKDEEDENFMIGYDVNNNEAKTEKIPLQLKSQGITFVDYENQLYLINSASRGVDNPSTLVIEKVDERTDENDHVVLEKAVAKEIALPNMSEDVYVDDETVYILFESAAKYYNDDWYSFLFTEKRHIIATTMDLLLEK